MWSTQTEPRCFRAWWAGPEYGNSDWQLVILPVICTVHFNINISEYFSVLHKYLFCQMAQQCKDERVFNRVYSAEAEVRG